MKVGVIGILIVDWNLGRGQKRKDRKVILLVTRQSQIRRKVQRAVGSRYALEVWLSSWTMYGPLGLSVVGC